MYTPVILRTTMPHVQPKRPYFTPYVSLRNCAPYTLDHAALLPLRTPRAPRTHPSRAPRTPPHVSPRCLPRTPPPDGCLVLLLQARELCAPEAASLRPRLIRVWNYVCVRTNYCKSHAQAPRSCRNRCSGFDLGHGLGPFSTSDARKV